MNKKQIFRIAGAFVLLAVGTIAGRAARFGNVATLYYTIGAGSSNCIQLASSITPAFGGLLTTGAGGVSQATIVSAHGVAHKLYRTNQCNTGSAVHFNG